MLEDYTPGYSVNATNFMASRTVDSHAGFFKSYLRSGMRLLDCGCGPGTITLGFASIVAPGTVTGIDRELSQVSIARENAVRQAISNAQFQLGDVYALPFVNDSFDAAFCHAVLEHLQQPIATLQELLRVLKPGGVVGVRSPDWGGFLIAPSNSQVEEAIAYYKLLQQQNGGNPYIGRHLPALLRQAGFTNIKSSATYECHNPLSSIAEYLALRIEISKTGDAGKSPILLSQVLREWSCHPDGFFAQAWCEAVGHGYKS